MNIQSELQLKYLVALSEMDQVFKIILMP